MSMLKGFILRGKRWAAAIAVALLAGLMLTAFFVWKAVPTVYAEPWDGNTAGWHLSGQAFDTLDHTDVEAGKAANPYTISTGGELALLGELIHANREEDKDYSYAHYLMTADIVLNDTTDLDNWGTYATEADAKVGGINAWTPIGTGENGAYPFSGTFDGGGHTVSGIYINNTGGNLGLFGILVDAAVKNLTVTAGFIKGYTYDGGNIDGTDIVGGIAGSAGNSEFANCTNGVTVSGRSGVGGIVGEIAGAGNSVGITNCANFGTVSGYQYIGGIAGQLNNITVEDCENTGAVTGIGDGGVFGGITGNMRGSSVVKNCENSATVSGYAEVGGIAGRLFDDSSWIESCTNSGDVNVTTMGGGIAGSSEGTVFDCKNSGAVSGIGDSTTIGGIAGFADGEIAKCTNTGAVSGDGWLGGIAGNVSGLVDGCVNSSSVTGTSVAIDGMSYLPVGGIAGDISASGSVINCENKAAVSGWEYVGGIVGSVAGETENCLNSGAVDGTTNVGGIAGSVDVASRVKNCVSSGAVDGTTNVGGIAGEAASYVHYCYHSVNAGLDEVGNRLEHCSTAFNCTFDDNGDFYNNGSEAFVTIDGNDYNSWADAFNAWAALGNETTAGKYQYITDTGFSQDCPHSGGITWSKGTDPTLTAAGTLTGTCAMCGEETLDLPSLLTESEYAYSANADGSTDCTYTADGQSFTFNFTAAQLFTYANTAGATEQAKIKLLSDMTTDNLPTLSGDIELDLNGKTLTLNDYITIKGSLTVTDSLTGGTIKEQGAYLFLLAGAGAFTLNEGTLSMAGDSTMKMIESSSSGDITINGGKITASTSIAIWHFNAGDIVINGGEITGSDSLIVHSGSGDVVITGGTMTATGNDNLVVQASGGGALTIGNTEEESDTATKAVLTSKCEPTTLGTVYIQSSSSLTILNNAVISNTATNGNAIYKAGTSTVTITGGTVSATGNRGKAIYNDGSGAVTITGGTVSATTTSTYGCAAIYSNGSGVITIGNDEDESDSAKKVTVTSNSQNVIEYGTVTLIHSGGESKTVLIIKNNAVINNTATAKNNVILNAGNGNIEMSGGTVTATAGESSAINNSGAGSVTISGGEVSVTGQRGMAIQIAGNALTVKGSGVVKATAQYGNAIYATSSSSSVMVENGEVLAEGNYGSAIYLINSASVVTVSGGKVSANGTDSYAIYNSKGNITVLGGEVETTGFRSIAIASATGTITIGNDQTGGNASAVTVSSAGGGASYAAIKMFATSGDCTAELLIYNNAVIKNTSTTASSRAIENNGSGRIEMYGSTVTISASSGRAINNCGTGDAVIDGGTVEATGNSGSAIYNDCAKSILLTGGATVQATGTDGTAIYNKGGGSVSVTRGTVKATGLNGTAIYNDDSGSVTVWSGTVEATGTNGNAIYNNAGGNITVKGGTVNSTGADGHAIYNNAEGEIIVEGGTVSVSENGYWAILNCYGTVTIGNDEAESDTATKAIVTSARAALSYGAIKLENHSNAANKIVLTIKNNAIISATAVTKYGNAITNLGAGKILMTGGVVKTNGTATDLSWTIYNKGAGNVAIEGGTVSADNGIAIYMEGTGVVTIGNLEDESVTATKAVVTSAITDSGTVYVAGGSAGQPSLIVKNNGEINNNSVVLCSALYHAGVGDINISGGTVKATNSSNGRAIFYNASGNITVSGGTVEVNKGIAIQSNTSGTGTITIAAGTVKSVTNSAILSNGKCTVIIGTDEEGATAKAIITSEGTDNDTTPPTISTNGTIHISAGDAGKDVLFVKNNAEIYASSASGKAICNNGNGNVTMSGGTVTATGEYGSAIYNQAGGNITISGGTVTATGESGRAINNYAGGNITVSGGTVEAMGDYDTAIYNCGSGSVILSGGTVKAVSIGINCSYTGSNHGSVTVSGGTVSTSGKGSITIYNGIGGKLTITSGEVTATGEDSVAIINDVTGQVTVSDGLVQSTGVDGVAIFNENAGNVTVSGGTVAADKFAIQNDGVGVITIKQISAQKPTRVEVTGDSTDAAVIKLKIAIDARSMLVLYGEYLYKTDSAKFIDNPNNAVVQIYAEFTAPADISKTYTGEDSAATAEVVGNFTPAWSWTLGGDTVSETDTLTVKNVKDSGTYTVTATVGAYGYTTEYSADVEVDIAKADSAVTAPTALNSAVHPGIAQALIEAGSTTGGTMLYALGDGEFSEVIPTASQAGAYTVKYKVDGGDNYSDIPEQSITVTLTATAHTYGAWQVTKVPTTAIAGNLIRACTFEGCSHTDTHVLPILNESNYTYSVTSGTCTTGEVRTYTYSSDYKDAADSPFVFKIPIPAPGHDLTHNAANLPTCTAAGNIEYWACSRCKVNFNDDAGRMPIPGVVMIPSPGHDMDKTEEVPETCTDDGNRAYWTCRNCNECFEDDAGNTTTTVDASIIPALGHYTSKTAAKAATCTAAGNIEHWKCTECDCYFEDEAAATPTTADDVVVDALGHKLTKTAAKAATCTAAGNIEYWTCSVCNGYFTDANAAKTTTADAVTIAAGHTLTATAAKTATFTATGNIAYWTCSTCGGYFEDAAATKATTADAVIIPVRTDYTITVIGTGVDSDFFADYALGMALAIPPSDRIFAGWYLDAEFTKPILSVNAADLPENGELTLYAKWESDNDGLSGGAIAGIVVGSVAALAIAGFAVFWFAIRRKTFADLLAIFKKK